MQGIISRMTEKITLESLYNSQKEREQKQAEEVNQFNKGLDEKARKTTDKQAAMMEALNNAFEEDKQKKINQIKQQAEIEAQKFKEERIAALLRENNIEPEDPLTNAFREMATYKNN